MSSTTRATRPAPLVVRGRNRELAILEVVVREVRPAVVRGRAGKVLDRRYRAGHALLKIAEELGLRESGVKSILVRTRRKLRTCIESRLHA